MKPILMPAILGAGLLAAGCLVPERAVTLDPVGPAPVADTSVKTGTGSLTVYSAFEVSAHFNSPDSYRPEYSNYRLYAGDGALLKPVANDTGLSLGSPATIRLPAGRYVVKARANGYGTVTVPVVIKPGRHTTVHLEGGSAWPDKAAADDANAVRLPDGNLAGWRG